MHRETCTKGSWLEGWHTSLWLEGGMEHPGQSTSLSSAITPQACCLHGLAMVRRCWGPTCVCAALALAAMPHHAPW